VVEEQRNTVTVNLIYLACIAGIEPALQAPRTWRYVSS
jgi:hypothetical protein